MKKITAIIMSMILLISLSVSASAASALTFLLPEYDMTSTDILCYGKKLPAGGKLEVSVNSQLIGDVSLSTLGQAQIPVTVYCLVDSSTSQSDKVAQQRTDLLLNLSSLMGPEDSMVIATIDATLRESKAMDSKTVRDTAIKTIDGTDWRTNLYDGMSEALKALETSTSYNTNRCLIVISEGHDDKHSLAKPEEVLTQIREIGIPVYSVILGSQISEADLTEQKQFADESLGGYLAYPEEDKLTGSETAQRLWSHIKSASVIRVGVDKLRGAVDDQQLLIRYDTFDTRYEDTVLIRAVDLPPAMARPIVTKPADEAKPGFFASIPVWVFVACGVGVALVGIGIAAYFLLRKKPGTADDSVPAWSYNEVPGVSGSTGSSSYNYSGQGFSAGNVTMPVANRCHVSVVALMHPEIAVDFYLTPNMETTFGRTEKANVILNPKDTQLSGCHGAFFWDGKKLLVQDRKSTNGTAVNGEMCPKNAWLNVEPGAVLTVGRYDYRIKFTK